ncbi:MAG TPA: GNAT family N-acetyltransferase [Dehalococcoidia bacterium]
MPEAVSVPVDLRVRADANYRELFRTMARVSPDGFIREEDGLLLVYTGPLLPMFNAAHLLYLSGDPAVVLARAREFFALFGQRWAFTVTGDDATRVAPHVEAAGMERLEPSPGMVLGPLAGQPPAVPGLEIRRVEDPDLLHVYNDTMTGGFGGGAWAEPEILRTPALLDIPDLTHYVGFVEGMPVATAMRFTSHRIAGVFNVSTVPAYRRRGVGEAMTWRAALDGLAEGAVASALQASAMGAPVYARMGYRTWTNYQLWLSPASATLP